MGMGWMPGNGAHANMSGAQYTKNGLLIPAEWLKKMGDDINVQRAGAVVIIESNLWKQSSPARQPNMIPPERAATDGRDMPATESVET